jgi:hypothetical protein
VQGTDVDVAVGIDVAVGGSVSVGVGTMGMGVLVIVGVAGTTVSVGVAVPQLAIRAITMKDNKRIPALDFISAFLLWRTFPLNFANHTTTRHPSPSSIDFVGES